MHYNISCVFQGFPTSSWELFQLLSCNHPSYNRVILHYNISCVTVPRLPHKCLGVISAMYTSSYSDYDMHCLPDSYQTNNFVTTKEYTYAQYIHRYTVTDTALPPTYIHPETKTSIIFNYLDCFRRTYQVTMNEVTPTPNPVSNLPKYKNEASCKHIETTQVVRMVSILWALK